MMRYYATTCPKGRGSNDRIIDPGNQNIGSIHANQINTRYGSTIS
jgi:hypothetical protein